MSEGLMVVVIEWWWWLLDGLTVVVGGGGCGKGVVVDVGGTNGSGYWSGDGYRGGLW